MHVLLIEDDLDLGRALIGALKAEGITSEWLRRVMDARHDLEGYSADCVLLDLALPGGTGFDLLARWRGSSPSTVPIIIITAISSLKDRLAGLNAGADDFLVKPFATAELVARIHAVVRRSAQQVSDVWTFGDLQLEPRRYQAPRRIPIFPTAERSALEGPRHHSPQPESTESQHDVPS